MSTRAQRDEAVVLEAAARHRVARHEHRARLVEELLAERRVPCAPPFERALHLAGVEVVGAVIHPDGFAHVRRLGERVRDRAGVEQRHAPAATRELERGRDAEDPGSDDAHVHDVESTRSW